MKFVILTGMGLTFASSAFGQRHASPYFSFGGYPNILSPGTGHGLGQAASSTVPNHHDGSKTTATHSHPGAAAILTPLLMDASGYADDYPGVDSSANTDPAAFRSSNQPPPTGFDLTLPPGDQHSTDCCANANADRIEPRIINEGKPTIYLIAFKNHAVVQALGYWMESGVLHYVSTEYGLNQATVDLIDWNLSQRLNVERGVQFKLPN